MVNSIIIFLGIILVVLIFCIIQLFRMSLNDFLEKTLKNTLWIWLPFHALKRLTREYKKKKMQ